MDYITFASWLSMIWVRCPLNRIGREVLIRILICQPLEFRVTLLNYQIRELLIKNT